MSESRDVNGSLARGARNPWYIHVFFGSHGLRAGWGITLFFLLLLCYVFARETQDEITHLDRVIPKGLSGPLFTPWGLVIEACIGIISVVVCAFLLARPKHFSAGKALASVVCMIIPVCSFVLAVSYLHHAQPPAPSTPGPAKPHIVDPFLMLIYESIFAAAVLLATWVMSRVERRPFGVYGLVGSPRRWRHFAHGLAVGIVSVSVLIGTLWAAHWLTFSAPKLHGVAEIAKYAAIWALLMLAVGVLEESLSRGYLQFALTRGFGGGGKAFFFAAVVTSTLFGLSHLGNTVESPIGIANAALIGPIFCLSLWLTRSLWWAIGMHAAWDWGQSFLFGTPDSGQVSIGSFLTAQSQGPTWLSGGGTGPEGSVLCTAILIFVTLYGWMMLRGERSKGAHL